MLVSRKMLRLIPMMMLLAGVMLLGGCKDRQQLAVENTQTGNVFTPEKYAAVKIGDNLKDVRANLGQPYQALADNEGRKHLIFSWPRDKKKEYVGYDLFFGPDDKVIQKLSIILYEEL